jgi:hypothetical protein
MRFTDRRGQRHTLTFPQFVYLDKANSGGFDCGWGGLDSTRTVRLLRERGLLDFREGYPGSYPRWRVTGSTKLGREILERWKETA